jgi:hypothetical protein
MKHLITPIANGGAPIYLDDLINGDLENKKAYEAILAGLDSKIILSGVEVSNLLIGTFDLSAGFVYLNGTVMEIPAYSGSYPIYIHEATAVNDDRDFEDGNTDTVATTRSAEYTATPSGDSIELNPTSGYYLETVIRRSAYNIGDVRLLTDLTDKFDGTGLGLDTSVERGFALCNGSNGTPDLSGKFLVGYEDQLVNDYDTIGNTGGEEEHLLTGAESGTSEHSHRVNGTQIDYTTGGGTITDALRTNQTVSVDPPSQDSVEADATQPHENRPPYYVLAYVMKVS